MALPCLNIEVLETIILHTLPEGFENMALTCRKIYTISKPFIQRHNTLRTHFRSFTYFEKMADSSFTIRSAFDLIVRIAVEPIVARYVRHADLRVDSIFLRGRPREFNPDVHCDDTLLRLFSESPELKEGGLDWCEYFSVIEEDLQSARYSQYASAFLLTLLPNVKTLILPRMWKPLAATDSIINAVIDEAKRSARDSCDPASLAQTTKFETSSSLGPKETFELAWACPFLALPHLRSFRAPSCVALEDSPPANTYIPSYPYSDTFGERLVTANLVSCCIDHRGISDFLKHTRSLRTLRYSHSTKNDSSPSGVDWDICRFIMAIGHRVGSFLEELSVTISDIRGSIAPGRVSMQAFQHLRQLQLPLQVPACNVMDATDPQDPDAIAEPLAVQVSLAERHEFEGDGTCITDLIPSSVARLALISTGTNDHAKILEIIFRHFAARKAFKLPALEEIQLSYYQGSEDRYQRQCTELYNEAANGDVALYLMQWPSSCTLSWDEGY